MIRALAHNFAHDIAHYLEASTYLPRKGRTCGFSFFSPTSAGPTHGEGLQAPPRTAYQVHLY